MSDTTEQRTAPSSTPGKPGVEGSGQEQVGTVQEEQVVQPEHPDSTQAPGNGSAGPGAPGAQARTPGEKKSAVEREPVEGEQEAREVEGDLDELLATETIKRTT